MPDATAIDLLKRIRAQKGCSLEELTEALPDAYLMTDFDPQDLLQEPLLRLVSWGLVQAFGEEGLVPAKTFESSGRLSLREYTYYLSPIAAAMEDALGFSFTGSKSIFKDVVRPQEWPQIFVLMPFDEALKPVYDDHIKKIAGDMRLTCARADDFFSVGSVVDEIWSAINNAAIVIADCTGRNPNVFYEIGVAHAVGKDTILISQAMDDVPFDLRHLRVLGYSYTPRGMAKLEADLKDTLGAIGGGSSDN